MPITTLGWFLARGAVAVVLAACARGDDPAAAPVEVETVYEVNGIQLYTRSIGTGEPIVVVHGGPGLDHTYFLPGLRGLAADHRLVFYDQRAVGRSSGVVDSASMAMDTFLADIDGLRAALGLERVALLGHSFGGVLAIRYALAYPERLDRLILMNPSEPGLRYRQMTAARQAAARTAEDSAALATLTTSEEFQRREPAAMSEMYRIVFRSTFADTANANKLVIDLNDQTARNGALIPFALFASLGAFDDWDRVSAIRAPTLVVHGAEDPIPVAMVRDLCDRIPDCTLALIEQAGHFPWIEQPEPTFAAVRNFMAGATSPSR